MNVFIKNSNQRCECVKKPYSTAAMKRIRNSEDWIRKLKRGIPNGSRRIGFLASQEQVNPKKNKKTTRTPNLPPMMMIPPETNNQNRFGDFLKSWQTIWGSSFWVVNPEFLLNTKILGWNSKTDLKSKENKKKIVIDLSLTYYIINQSYYLFRYMKNKRWERWLKKELTRASVIRMVLAMWFRSIWSIFFFFDAAH